MLSAAKLFAGYPFDSGPAAVEWLVEHEDQPIPDPVDVTIEVLSIEDAKAMVRIHTPSDTADVGFALFDGVWKVAERWDRSPNPPA